MDHRVKGLGSALAILLGAACGAASAQSSTWRVANYGTEFSTAGIAPQALALDASNDPYAFAFVANGAESAIRLSHYHGADGTIIWQRDVALSEAPWFPFSTYNSGRPTAALASVGTDAVLAATNYDTQFYGRIARYAGGDGDLVWGNAEHAPTAVAYEAVAVDAAGNVIAAGAAGDIDVSPTKGHVAKFHAGDGSLAWSVDLDAAACGAGSSLWFQFTTVSVDDNGDVVAGGFSPYEHAFPFCAFKLSGIDGSVKWTYAYLPHGASFVSVAVDGGGDPVFAVGSDSNYSLAIVKVDGTAGTKVWSRDPVSAQPSGFGVQPFVLTPNGDVVVSAAGTRGYASTDGHLLWPQDAPASGVPTIDSSGNIVIVSNDWSNGKINLFRLSIADGSVLWSTGYALDTVGYWDYPNLVIGDSAGHFLALQSFSQLCCADKQSLLLHGDASNGSIDWHVRDRNVAPSNAIQFEPNPVFSRTSAPTPDGGIVGVGTAYLGVPENARGPADRITVIKRSLDDGHLLWRAVPDLGLEYCVPSSLVVDGNGDVIIGGSCNGKGQTIKFGGSDGHVLWAASKQDGCDYAAIDSVSVDSGNNVYATGWCEPPNSYLQLTVRFDGATGAPSWQKLTAAAASSYSQFLVGADSAGGVIFAGTENLTGDPNSAAVSLIVNKLHAVDGSPVWSQHFDPPENGFESLAALALYSNGDVAVAAIESLATSNTLAARLRAVDGAIKWATHDTAPEMAGVTPRAMTLDAQENVLLAGGAGAWKYSGATGTRSWILHGLPASVTGESLNDVIAAPDGTVAVTGACNVAGRSVPNLCVVDIASATGLPVWTAVDLPAEPGYSVGIGLVAGADGAMVVSGNYAVPNASPWSLVRVIGPSTDDLFPNGFEP